MTNMQLQRESLLSASLDTVPQREATTPFDGEQYRQLPRRIAPHLVARKVLGEGGTAIVFGAFHTRLKLPVAVKILKLEGESSTEAALRMHREAELCARLDSPRFPRIYDVDTLADGTPYVVMEEIHGRPLDELLSHGPLDFDLAVAIVCEVLEGLAELHEAGVIHRDIKPSNLILEDDQSGAFRVRMLDLGIAKSMHDASSPDALGSNPGVSLTQRGCLLGTPHYMSTEQLMGAPVDQRTDLYSVGVLLYETLSGRLPFQGETAGSVIAAALRDSPIAIRVLRPDVPEELEYIVAKAMERDRMQRFSSAAEMLQALRSVAPYRLGLRPQARPLVSDPPFMSPLHTPTDLSQSDLRLKDPAQAWAARALHSVPPEAPKQRFWAARSLLAACAVLAGVVAWPTVTGRPESAHESVGNIAVDTEAFASTPFVPALTQPPRPERSVGLEYVDLLNGRLELDSSDTAPLELRTNNTAPNHPTASEVKSNTSTSSKLAPASRTRLLRPSPSHDDELRPSSLEIQQTDGVSLNSYVERMDEWLKDPPREQSSSSTSPIPDNPYQ